MLKPGIVTSSMFLLSSLVFILFSCNKPDNAAVAIEPGVSKSLATYRKSILTHIQYTLSLDIPADNTQSIPADEVLSFSLDTSINNPLQIDFKANISQIKLIEVNGRSMEPKLEKEHVLIDSKDLKRGTNTIHFNFVAGDAALNRRTDFLYSLFVPDRARTMFPCFDQPNLKATYTLSLTIPKDWKAIANGPLQDSSSLNGKTKYQFHTSDKLSTYLFAFVAGKFNIVTETIDSMPVSFLYRETDSAKLKSSMQAIFDAHAKALSFYEQWTGIHYPFQKFGFVAIPDFQFGGMEHVGTILYNANSIFLSPGATEVQLNARANVISHETAHMWFGDLVTMNWFSDVWMKEVFANFMADKCNQNLKDSNDYNLKFLTTHFTSAYSIDRTKGANPIRQQLNNLKDAGNLYGGIIYDKAPIMMRQLELLMGKENFRKGVSEYLKTYAFGNASWPDLIAILEKYSTANLQQWNNVWVNETGRPVFDYTMQIQDGKIKQFVLSQKPEYGKDKIWAQECELALFYKNDCKLISINLLQKDQNIPELVGLKKPDFVLFNSSGIGYGVWPVDSILENNLYQIKDPIQRGSAYISLYENMLNGRYNSPNGLLKLFIGGLLHEKQELNLRLISGYIESIYWRFINKNTRQQLSLSLENDLWHAMQSQTAPNNKKVLFQTYQNVFLSQAATDKLYGIWKSQKAPQGVQLSDDDYTDLALSLALRESSNATLLQEQLARIKNEDRRNRFKLIMSAVSSNEKERDTFFNGLSDLKNRKNESAVGAALGYLHHPLRQKTSEKYLAKTLNLLKEIQQTGDIFFPQRWLSASFDSYQNADAAAIVNNFLKSHPDYDPMLKAKILQTTDNLMRAQWLLKNGKPL
jgi:aminopeptidase N